MTIKNIAVLGSTGSVGTNTLKVAEAFQDRFRVVALTAFNNVSLLEKQIKKFRPKYVAVHQKGIEYLKRRFGSYRITFFDAQQGVETIVSSRDVDIVVLAIRGSAALGPFLEAVRHGKTVAPANKEAIVMAGSIITREAKRYNASIVPVDSEQSAIFQCLNGAAGYASGHASGCAFAHQIKKIYLTASGGPLHNVPQNRFDKLSIDEILRHPRWKMGKKITVDSATLMNKGLEVIEAKWLFGVDVDQIEVVVHPEAIIHSMVEFCDGSILAQLGVTDMRLPIQYALTYPNRLKTQLPQIDFFKLGKLTFKKPDFKKFPSVQLCYHAGKKGGTAPAALNAANEEAVDAFLDRKISFSKIYKIVEKVVHRHKNIGTPDLKDIWRADGWAREEAKRFIAS